MCSGGLDLKEMSLEKAISTWIVNNRFKSILNRDLNPQKSHDWWNLRDVSFIKRTHLQKTKRCCPGRLRNDGIWKMQETRVAWFVCGSHPLLPFTLECYQCKMAVCLSEPPASTLELLWSNASWDRSVCFCLHFWLSLFKQSPSFMLGVVVVIIPSHPSVFLGRFHADRAFGA